MSTPATYGLRLTLGGAPNTWHTVTAPDGSLYPGLFHPEIPAPLETLGLTLDEARTLERIGGVKVVTIPKGRVREAAEATTEAVQKGRRAALSEQRARPGEADTRAAEEYAATTAVTTEAQP